MANVLGLDLGRQCGFALASSRFLAGWKPRSAIEGPRASNAGLVYGPWKLGIEGSVVESWYANLWERLSDLHSVSPLSLVAYESSNAQNIKTEKALFSTVGLPVVVMTWCRAHGVEQHRIKNNQLKKHAAGHGWADKDAIDAAARRLGWDPQTEDVADGLFVLDLCLTEWSRK